MIRFVLALTFACSLLFNVFFALGLAQSRVAVEPAGGVAQLAADLQLDDDQRAALESIRAEFHAHSALSREALALAQTELTAALSENPPDLDKASGIVEHLDRINRGDGVRPELVKGFLGSLGPEQCRRLSGRLRQERGRRWERMMRRFDVDGDGDLSEDERAAARADHEQRRAEFLARFDRDGDGALSEEERRAAREQMGRFRDGRRPPRGRSGHEGRPPREHDPERDQGTPGDDG